MRMAPPTHVLAEIFNQPWMIRREKLQQIVELGELWAESQRLSKEEIQARVGKASDPPQPQRSGSVAVIPIYGVLAPKINLFMEISGGTSIETLTKQFRQAIADSETKAIVFDVDSPGGSVYGIDELAQEIFDARGQKPIYAQVSPMAGSAAYYLASQAHSISVTPTGEVGSIGVYAAHRDFSEQMKQLGQKTTLISAGKYKVEGNPFEPLSEEARGYMQERVDDYYGMFVGAVARGRATNASSVRDGMGQGRMVGARQALELNMADAIGTLEDTVAGLKEATMARGATIMSAAAGLNHAISIAAALADENGALIILPSHLAEQDSPANLPENTTEAAALKAVASGPRTHPSHSISATAETMEAPVETPNPTSVKSAAEITSDANARASTILTLAQRHGMGEKAAAWIKDGKTIEDVQTAILDGKFASTAALTPPASITSEHATDKIAKTPGGRFARCVRAMAFGRGDVRRAAQHAETVFHDPYCAAALGASTGASGGFIVPEDMASEIIEFLRPQTVVRSLNPVLAPMPRGTMTLPKLTGGATASYVGENQNLPNTNPTFGQVKLAARKLAGLVPISNDLVRYDGGIAADIIVRDDLASAIAQAEDSAFIRSLGTVYTPKGLRYWAASANVIAANGTTSLANTRADIGKIRIALRKANVRFLRPGWIMSPRTEEYLLNLADANGNLVYYNEMVNNGTFRRFPYRVTTLIPENLGGGSNESELYLADFADVIIGEVPGMVIETSTEAAYYDGAAVQAAFSLDQTVIKMIMEHDLAVRHAESVAVLTTLLWT